MRPPVRLGVLGGSFNPVHAGHIAMALAARKAHGLDRVLLVPSARPPHKREDLAPAEDRFEMVRLAVEGFEGLEASRIELDRPGPSYTVDTLEELRRLHPGVELFFILGEDSIPELPTWRRADRILEIARVVAVNRPGCAAAFRPQDFPRVPAAVLARLEADRVAMPPCPAESRRVRELLRQGLPAGQHVPAKVSEHIRRRGLYRER
ncbi:MAG: nicotinate (nicotinamide) nucleotide adenylyltransferase [Planctomycetes bacterium]|nr:nicotinate (nicotinamide) nucleotide adenylyltransferase [Planctomycetota bacterium]